MRRPEGGAEGHTLPELLLVAALLAGLAATMLLAAGSYRARLRVEAALRRVALGLELGRVSAERQGQACGLRLAPSGWQAPSGGSLPACSVGHLPLEEGLEGRLLAPELSLQHNLPAAVRFSSNGLILDGGTVVLAAAGAASRCLVVSPPLGVVRQGIHDGHSCQAEAG